VYKDNNITFEKYKHSLEFNGLKDLQLHKGHIHQSAVRYSLVDFLVNKWTWQYWIVVTFGYKPQKYEVEETLRASHYHLDRWLLTNRKLDTMPVDVRSELVCLPEKGSEGHLHYNCFLKFKLAPDAKTYGTRWNAVRVAFNQIFKKLEKGFNPKINIAFELYDKRRKADALLTAMYSTKEMRQGWIQDNKGEDHFANALISWLDWQVVPINKRSPKKLQSLTKPSATLTQFMQ